MLNRQDLYPLADAVGFDLTLKEVADCQFMLEGGMESALTIPGLGLNLPMQAAVVESHCDTYLMQTTGVRVAVLGMLHFIITLDHKRKRLETFVVNADALPEAGVFERKWSRLRFMYAVRNAVKAHFVWEPSQNRWVETPNGALWVQDYLLGREQHKLDADDALELADLLAFGSVARSPDVYHKWRISTDARRREMAGLA